MKRTGIEVSGGEREVLSAFGDEITVLHDGASTDGKLTAVHVVTPPGSGPPPHYHDDEEEWFYPLEGSMEFLVDGAWRAIAVGEMVYVPRKTVHTFRNAGETPLRTLIQLSPSGFERFFRRCAAEFAKPGAPDMSRIVEIAAEHGVHFVD